MRFFWNRYKTLYKSLEPAIQAHYKIKLVFSLSLFILPIGMFFILNYPKGALFIFAFIVGYFINILYTIHLFCEGKIYKLTGICEGIDQQRIKKNYFIIHLNLYGKCTMYVRSDNVTYAVQISHNNLYKVGSRVTIWYDGNSYESRNKLHIIPYSYIITEEP